MQLHKVTQQIVELLKTQNVWFETFTHEPVRTSEEAAKTRPGYTISQGAKAIIIRVKAGSEKKFVMLVLPGDLRFFGVKVKRMLGTNDLRFATEDEVLNLTEGVQPGGVPPFGNLFGIEVVVDPKLFEHEKIVFNAGERSFSVAMTSADYQKLVHPRVESITSS